MNLKNLLKFGIVLILSLIVVLTFNQAVSAADGDDWIAPVTSNGVGNTSTGNSIGNSIGGNSIGNYTGGNSSGSVSNNVNKLSNTNTSKNNTSNNEIPYTGNGSVGSVVTITIILGTIIAVYSYKKIMDYRSI